MLCRRKAIGIAVLFLGVGLLIGSILSSCLPVWLLALALTAAGVCLLQC